MDYNKAALALHSKYPGKIAVQSLPPAKIATPCPPPTPPVWPNPAARLKPTPMTSTPTR